MSDDADTIRVPKARLREVKEEIDRLQHELAALREEHENLRAHLKGSIQQVDRLTKENERLRR
jgi:regulator of replication initiation timing